MARTNVTSLQRRLAEWIQQPAQERNYHRGPLQMIETALGDPRRTTQLSIASILLGNWHLARGQAAVLDGDSTGWDEARLGVAFQRTALLLRCRRRNPRGPRNDATDLPVLQTANCICLGLALGDPHAEDLFAAFADLPDSSFPGDSSYPMFVRELLVLRQGRRPTVTPRLGSYGEVLQHWQGDGQLLARRLAALLDVHLDETQGAPGKPAAFDEPGMLLYPAEVLAVRAVRFDLDLPWPKVDHPMMHTNLVTMEPLGEWPEDSLLARIDRVARS